MKVAVLGASRRAGSAIVKELAARGHQVLAVARRPEAITSASGVMAKAGNAANQAELSELVGGMDAVINTLHFDVRAKALLSALKQAGVGRLWVTGGQQAWKLLRAGG